MKLTKLSYIDPYWELKDLVLGKVNLIVGKNSTGKSRTLSTIDLLAKMITQKRALNWGARWEMGFTNYKGDSIAFNFATQYNAGEGKVSAEFIYVNDQKVLARGKDGTVSIKNEQTNQFDTVSPPQNKLALHTNRDIKKYPYLEDIVGWAEHSYGFKFGNISPLARLNQQEYDLLTTVEDIPELYKQLPPPSQADVLKKFNAIGYDALEITIQDRGDFPVLYLKEKGVEKEIPHYKLSQGMFRSLALLVFLEYLIARKQPATIIIDDLCEGLDYDKATQLGKVVFKTCLEQDIQLIATSNDSFLMDIVDLEHWSILSRSGKVVSALSKAKNKDLFEHFRYTGLSNFDFFSSDYIAVNEK